MTELSSTARRRRPRHRRVPVVGRRGVRRRHRRLRGRHRLHRLRRDQLRRRRRARVRLGRVRERGESWLTAAVPMGCPYCSCKLTRPDLHPAVLQLHEDGDLPHRAVPAAPGPGDAGADLLRRCRRVRAVPRDDAVGGRRGGGRGRPGESWLTAAIPMDNPYCSCKLTRGRHHEGVAGGRKQLAELAGGRERRRVLHRVRRQRRPQLHIRDGEGGRPHGP